MSEIVGLVKSLYKNAFNLIFCLEDGILGGKRVDGLYPGVLTDGCHQRGISGNWGFLRDHRFVWLLFLDTDMSPETKYLLAYSFLESIGKSQGDDHDRYADHSSHNR